MICKFSVENYKAFSEKVQLDFFADRNIKRLDYNFIESHEKSILKTAGFYGPNNTGKTCILSAPADLRALMLNEPHENFANVFAGKGDVTSFEVEYLINGRFYIYAVSFNNRTRTYERESLFQKYLEDGSTRKERIFERSPSHLTWKGLAPGLEKAGISRLFSFSFPFLLILSDPRYPDIEMAAKDYRSFAQSIAFIRMDAPLNISMTINLMQNNAKANKFITEFVKNCDLHIEDFGFQENVKSDIDIGESLKAIAADPAFPKETLKLSSQHNGYHVPSVFFDSVGTKKLIALSGFIYKALAEGNVLIIDEIESSLHHIITKSIVAMFNNMLNSKAQLFFTTHDLLLMDLKNLLRKDQVWLVDISDDHQSSQVIRMSDKFTARSENGIRGDEDITDYYLHGQFGSIPTPDLFSSLEEAIVSGE